MAVNLIKLRRIAQLCRRCIRRGSRCRVPLRKSPLQKASRDGRGRPPQLFESGSSCTARKPQSAWPVIGSTGIFRRNRIFLSPLAPTCRPVRLSLMFQGLEDSPRSRLLVELGSYRQRRPHDEPFVSTTEYASSFSRATNPDRTGCPVRKNQCLLAAKLKAFAGHKGFVSDSISERSSAQCGRT
jgi:hypothetical protein